LAIEHDEEIRFPRGSNLEHHVLTTQDSSIPYCVNANELTIVWRRCRIHLSMIV